MCLAIHKVRDPGPHKKCREYECEHMYAHVHMCTCLSIPRLKSRLWSSKFSSCQSSFPSSWLSPSQAPRLGVSDPVLILVWVRGRAGMLRRHFHLFKCLFPPTQPGKMLSLHRAEPCLPHLGSHWVCVQTGSIDAGDPGGNCLPFKGSIRLDKTSCSPLPQIKHMVIITYNCEMQQRLLWFFNGLSSFPAGKNDRK